MRDNLGDQACVPQSGLHKPLKYVLALVAFACLKTASPQQQPSPLPDFRIRIRISVNLVQVDATVTDSRGKPVSDLTADDFRILLDGKPQTIASCNFIQAGGVPAPPAAVAQPSVPKQLEAALPPMPVAPLKREQVRRTVVFFVDDLSMSSESVPAVRNGLRKFIEQQLQPGDLAAIVRASAGLGALQDLTNDRRLLLAAAGQVRWNPVGRGGISAYTQVGNNPSEGLIMGTTLGQEETISRIRNYTVAAGSSLRRLVHGMKDLPGRKSVVILSDSLPIRTPDDTEPLGTQSVVGNSASASAVGSGTGGPILAGMRSVIDESVRAGVVIYAIDTRGLNSFRALAADRPSSAGTPEFALPGGSGGGIAQADGDWIWDAMQVRRDEYSEGQWGAKPGPYQVRAACSDESTGKMGAASDFVVVPKLKGLALSGIVFQHSLGVEDHVRPATGARSYAPGERAEFALQVINAPDAPLIMRTRLFRDGSQVHDGPPQPVDARSPKVAGRFLTHAAIEIPADLAPGDYLLRVDIEDQLPPPSHARAWQWARLTVGAAEP